MRLKKLNFTQKIKEVAMSKNGIEFYYNVINNPDELIEKINQYTWTKPENVKTEDRSNSVIYLQDKELQKDIEWIGNRFDNERRDLETLINNVETSTDGRFDNLERHANKITDEVNQRIDKDNEQIYRQIDETRSYIDSRIDKLEAKKQLIKG